MSRWAKSISAAGTSPGCSCWPTPAGLWPAWPTRWLVVQVRHRLDYPLLVNLVTILTPLTAFLLAEVIHASGVLAVVVCGLVMSQAGPRVVQADTK